MHVRFQSLRTEVLLSIPAPGLGLDCNILMCLGVLGVAIQIFKGFLRPDHNILKPNGAFIKPTLAIACSVNHFNPDCVRSHLERYCCCDLHILWGQLIVTGFLCHAYTNHAGWTYLQVDFLVVVCY